jgi:hypothetical protein
MGNANNFK